MTICWLTFWGGLLFFLGQEKPDSVTPAIKILTTLILVATNVIFLLISSFIFVREYLKDRKRAQVKKESKLNSNEQTDTQIVPINENNNAIDNENEADNDDKGGNEDNNDARFTPAIARNKRNSLSHTRSTVAKAEALHDDHIMHEKGFQQKTEKRQARAKRKTELRVQARIKLKDSKVLQEIPAFKMLKKEEVNVIIDAMAHIVR